jgi:hypothetical protein
MARPKKNPDFVELKCKTCNTDFRVKWQKRNKQKYCCKSCSNKDPEVLAKMRASQVETSLKKYGTDHPMKTSEVVNNFKNSMMTKYGVEHALQSKAILDKAKYTNVQNYGVENVLSSKSPVRQRIMETWIEKYGVDNPGKSRDVIQKRSKLKQENHYEKLKALFNSQNVKWLCKQEDYAGYHFSHRYKFNCKKCNNGFESTVYVPTDVFCELCHPEKKETAETGLQEFLVSEVKGKTILRNNRVVLDGKELDFYIPDLSFAIEYNGLYWHRASHPRMSKNYHLEKTEKCAEKNIHLIHILESEWKHKQNIVKSIIRQYVCGHVAKIHGR